MLGTAAQHWLWRKTVRKPSETIGNPFSMPENFRDQPQKSAQRVRILPVTRKKKLHWRVVIGDPTRRRSERSGHKVAGPQQEGQPCRVPAPAHDELILTRQASSLRRSLPPGATTRDHAVPAAGPTHLNRLDAPRPHNNAVRLFQRARSDMLSTMHSRCCRK